MPSARSLAKLALLIALVVAGAALAWRLGLFDRRGPVELAAAIRSARERAWAAPAFVATYAIVAALGLPATLFTLAGGAIFGLALGAALNWLGATLGASGGYALARLLGREAVRGLLGRRAAALDRLAGERGFLAVLRLRLIPVVPFNALNFAAGLAGVSWRDFLLATALGIVPGTLVYTYFADSLLAGAEGTEDRALLHVAVAGGLLLLLSFVPTIVRKRRGGQAARGATR